MGRALAINYITYMQKALIDLIQGELRVSLEIMTVTKTEPHPHAGWFTTNYRFFVRIFL